MSEVKGWMKGWMTVGTTTTEFEAETLIYNTEGDVENGGYRGSEEDMTGAYVKFYLPNPPPATYKVGDNRLNIAMVYLSSDEGYPAESGSITIEQGAEPGGRSGSLKFVADGGQLTFDLTFELWRE